MVFGIGKVVKGPKAMLSGAIATALGKYFVVDENLIESNLLSDTKIVLNQVELKKNTQILFQTNGSSSSSSDGLLLYSVAEITGQVEQVIFSWKWNVSSSSSSSSGTSSSRSSNSKSNSNSNNTWVQDATLTIKGLDFKAKLSWKDGDFINELKKEENEVSSSSSSKSNKNNKKKESGGRMSMYIKEQVAMVVDSLKLLIQDYKFTCEYPTGTSSSSSSDNGIIQIVVSGSTAECISFGRNNKSNDSNNNNVIVDDKNGPSGGVECISPSSAPTTTAIAVVSTSTSKAFLPLEQVLILESFQVVVHEISNLDASASSSSTMKSYPLLGKFSYKARAVRVAGERFLTGLQKGLIVEGFCDIVSTGTGGGSGAGTGADLTFYAGPLQLRAMKLLSTFVLAPPSQSSVAKTKETKKKERDRVAQHASESSFEVSHDDVKEIFNNDDDESIISSSFTFPLHSLSLELESSTISLSSVVMNYHADGTIAQVNANRLKVMPKEEEENNQDGEENDKKESEKMEIDMKDITVSARPYLSWKIGIVETFYIPGVVQVTKPIHGITIYRQDVEYEVKFPSVHATRLEKKVNEDVVAISPDNKNNKKESKIGATKKGPFGFITKAIKLGQQTDTKILKAESDNAKDEERRKENPTVPFPVNIAFEELFLTNSRGKNALTVCRGIDLDIAPGTIVSVCMQEVLNDMLEMKDVACSAVIPADAVDEIHNLHFAAASLNLTAGHSSEEWEERFDTRKPKKKEGKTNYKLPNVHIEALSLRVALKGKLLSAKDTEMVIKSFIGDETTTQTDVVRHYTQSILARSPGFITNAEVLGVNAVDTGFVLAARAAGPLGGLAAVAGVDAVKGVIAAGKRSRGNTKADGDLWQVSDVVHGVFYAAKEAADEGAAIRGKSKEKGGNVIDWAVGASTGTTKYAQENKSRLGAAGAGGAAVIAGTILAGPIGGLAAGLVTSAVTGKALEKADSDVSKDKK